MFRNKIYSNLKQNSFQEKGMKSLFPSHISGLRGQGPDTLPEHGQLRPQETGTEPTAPAPQPARTIHAFQMTKGLKTAFLYNILF